MCLAKLISKRWFNCDRKVANAKLGVKRMLGIVAVMFPLIVPTQFAKKQFDF
jgi:hypothetical protein